MRRGHQLLCFIAMMVVAAPAFADPPQTKASDNDAKPASDEKTKPTSGTKTTPRKRAKPAAQKAKKTAKPANLRLSDPAAAKPPTIDLFPSSVLGSSKRAEEQPGITLGDDTSWKTHAAQASAMVIAFGALAALCGGGNCMIPGSVTDALPDFLKAKPYKVVNPRPPQPIKPLR